MIRRYTSQELFDLRNRVPIRYIIEKLLDIPTRNAGGVFRFRCPQCASFQTSVNPKTNLARCFDCAINFNTIEMVMIVKGIKFTQSVKLLQHILSDLSSEKIREVVSIGNQTVNSLPVKAQVDTSGREKKGNAFVSIGSVLQHIHELKNACSQVDADAQVENRCLMMNRVEKIEQEVFRIDRQLDQLKAFVIQFVKDKYQGG